jgi:hypothetical protein
MQLIVHKRAFVAAMASFVAALALTVSMASNADAAEQHFCWGANIAPSSSCSSGNWWMNSSYVNSSDGPVCMQLAAGENLYNCMKSANEGLYINNGNCAYGHVNLFNWTAPTKKVYGVFWTC